MPRDDFERFRNEVLHDLSLQEQLRDIQDRELFIKQVVRLGREHGYSFDIAEVTSAMQASRRAWIERGLG